MPEVGMEGQLKLKNAKVLLIGTGGLGAPLGLYLAAAGVGRLGLWISMSWISRIFSGKSLLARAMSANQERSGTGAAVESEPGHSDRCVRNKTDQRECAGTFQGFRHHRGWHRQFPDALSGQRCVHPCSASQTFTARFFVLKDRRRCSACRGAVLPLPLSGTASAGAGAILRRGRRARRVAGHRRLDPGDGNDQIDSWTWREPGRALVALRCAWT